MDLEHTVQRWPCGFRMLRAGWRRHRLRVASAAVLTGLVGAVALTAHGEAAAWEPSTAELSAAVARVHAIAEESTVGDARTRTSDGWPAGVRLVTMAATTR